MKKLHQKAVIAESNILQEYNCKIEQVPHVFFVKKENRSESLDAGELHLEQRSSAEDPSSKKHHVLHFDHRYHALDSFPKYCDVLVHPSGWKFYSFHRHILQENEVKELSSRVKRLLLKQFPSVKKELNHLFRNHTQHHDQTVLSEKEFEDQWIDDDPLNINSFKLHLPPVLFGVDVMFLEYINPRLESQQKDTPHPGLFHHSSTSNPSGNFALTIDPSDAIYSWVCKHTKENLDKHSLNIPKVPFSDKWMNKLHEGLSAGQSAKLSAESAATESTAIKTNDEASAHHSAENCNRLTSSNSFNLTHVRAFDWTYTTDYSFTLFTKSNANETDNTEEDESKNLVIYDVKDILRGRELDEKAAAPLTASSFFPGSFFHHSTHQHLSSNYSIRRIETTGVNYEMLKRRDLPILFYDEIILYEDDLEDCGEVSMEAKIRVMPNCWFILIKFFLRIDHVIVRCRETRLFHEFQVPATSGDIGGTKAGENATAEEKNKIYMEVVWKEKDLTEESQSHIHDNAHSSHPLTTSAKMTGPVHSASSKLGTFYPPPPSASSPMLANLHVATSRAGINPPSAISGTNASATMPISVAAHDMLLFKKYTKDNTNDLPSVNEKEKVSQYFEITL